MKPETLKGKNPCYASKRLTKHVSILYYAYLLTTSLIQAISTYYLYDLTIKELYDKFKK